MSALRWQWIFLALVPAGCGGSTAMERPPLPDDVLDFPKLFQANCQGCHGKEGKVGPAPPLNDPLFLAIVPESELKRVIGQGRRNTLMPAFGNEHGGSLTAKQVEVLAEGLKKTWALPADKPLHWPQPLPEYKGLEDADGSPAGDKEAGSKVFAAACAGCHGPNGEGGLKAGRVNDRVFLGLISDQALRRIVITGRPDLGMPDYSSGENRSKDFHPPLTSQQIDDLVARLAAWREGKP